MEQWCRISGDYVVVMATELSSMRKGKPGGIMTHLSSAACEWFLIFLLFVDAVFSYFLREFAKYCELQTPCHLCSRLDRILGEKKLGCRWSLVCSSHKKEISSLVFCSIHGELADFHGMCEECFKSIAMQNDSECKLLVGKLWVDVERSSGSRICSCCNETWLAAKSDDESLGGYKANVELPLSHVLGCRRFSHREGMKRLRDKLTASMRQRALSRVGYTEFKLSSDSEPESPLPEAGGGDGDSSSSGDNHTRLENGVEFGKRDRLGMPVSSVISEKQTHRGSEISDPSSSEFCLAESQPRGSLRWTKDVVSVDHVSQPPDVGSLDASAESSNVSSDSLYIVPSASSTLRITKKCKL